MTKKIVLTGHARTRLRTRQLKVEWVEDTVHRPDWTALDPKDPNVERRFRAIETFGGRILRVVCVETESTIRVISALFDRNARRQS